MTRGTCSECDDLDVLSRVVYFVTFSIYTVYTNSTFTKLRIRVILAREFNLDTCQYAELSYMGSIYHWALEFTVIRVLGL